jgi:hypothetical protein
MFTFIKHYVGEIGCEIIIDTGMDLSNALALQLNVKKPDGTLATWLASAYAFSSMQNTGIIYTTVDGDFDQAGTYEIQPSITLSDWQGLAQTAKIVIYDKFA